jgi:hypothetical protein
MGRGSDGNVTPVGYFNNVLINMTNPANFASRAILSVRDPGGPILRGVSPSVAAQGQTLVVTLKGKNFAGRPLVDFGPGVTVLNTNPVPNGSDTLVTTIKVAPNASLGGRVIKVTNPDGEYASGNNRMFQVIDASLMQATAVHEDWQLYN